MSRSVARKRESTSYIIVLPDDLMHIIFAKLDMRDKVNAGMVCKQWDQVLRASTPAGRHWVINFNANRAARAASGTLDKDSSAHHSSVAIGRYGSVPSVSYARIAGLSFKCELNRCLHSPVYRVT
jgi:hypothetical protein